MLSKENMEFLYSITNTFLFRFIIIFGIVVGVMYIFVWTGANMSIFEPYLFFIIAFIIMYLFLESHHTSVLFDEKNFDEKK
jgi:hypothetical protein